MRKPARCKIAQRNILQNNQSGFSAFNRTNWRNKVLTGWPLRIYKRWGTSRIVTVSCPLPLGHAPTLLVLSTKHSDLKGFCLMFIQQWINIEKIIPHVSLSMQWPASESEWVRIFFLFVAKDIIFKFAKKYTFPRFASIYFLVRVLWSYWIVG